MPVQCRFHATYVGYLLALDLLFLLPTVWNTEKASFGHWLGNKTERTNLSLHETQWSSELELLSEREINLYLMDPLNFEVSLLQCSA
jgi:hypothetical protein